MSNAWQRGSHAGNAGIAIIFYKKRPIFCRNTQIDLVPDKEHIFKYMMLTNFNIFGFGDLKLVFLQIGWSYLDNSGTMVRVILCKIPGFNNR